MNFLQKLEQKIKKNNSLLCVGLDTDSEKINQSIFEFNKNIISKTADLVCCYKLNSAYYEAAGISGLEELKKTVEHLQKEYSDIPLICDAKRADVGSTSEQYAKAIFDYYNFDAVTVNPYLGLDSLEPFLNYQDKGIIILCKTSNKDSEDFQNLEIQKEPLYMKVAEKVVKWNNQFKNCLLVVGATYPQELKKIRDIAKDMFFLVPGIGFQGGDLENTVKNGLRSDKSGLILNSSRGIIYSQNPKQEAQQLRDAINKFRV